MVMASMSLDKIVYLIAGEDSRKPGMASARARHQLGRSVIEKFNPLFAYSSLAFDTALDGETNLGRLLSLNAGQPMEVFYIAGADHFRRKTACGEPDTIQKLERVVEEQKMVGGERNTISAVFLDREGMIREQGSVATSLKVHVLPPLPFSFSSTAVRQALCREAFSESLVSLPYSCLLKIQESGLYIGQGEYAVHAGNPA
jgi:hypothetical protein